MAQELSQGRSDERVTNCWKIATTKQEHSVPFLLSQGQQRRLAVAALLQRPVKLLLVDEPTWPRCQASLAGHAAVKPKAASGTWF